LSIDYKGVSMKIVDFFYTEDQAAKEMNVNRITIWRWIKEGRFDIQRVGREVLIPKWEVELIKVKKKKAKRLVKTAK
jgi:excisionase family DNA binding protein